MKHILATLLILCCVNAAIRGQGISFEPSTLIFKADSGAYAPTLSTTILGSGLIPANGYITVSAPVKFYISLGGPPIDFSVNIPYTGGVLPPTTVYVSFGMNNTGFATTATLTVTGGGAPTPNFCMCAFMATCPCATTNVPAVQNDPSIVVEPNPAHDYLNITAGDQLRNIVITNIMGQVQFNQEYNSDQVQVDVSALPADVYLVRINGTEVRKFVKD